MIHQSVRLISNFNGRKFYMDFGNGFRILMVGTFTWVSNCNPGEFYMDVEFQLI